MQSKAEIREIREAVLLDVVLFDVVLLDVVLLDVVLYMWRKNGKVL